MKEIDSVMNPSNGDEELDSDMDLGKFSIRHGPFL